MDIRNIDIRNTLIAARTSPFNGEPICTGVTFDNYFIPVIAYAVNQKLITVNERRAILYSFTRDTSTKCYFSSSGSYHRYKGIYEALLSSGRKLISAGKLVSLYFNAGTVLHNNEIIISFTVRRDKFLKYYNVTDELVNIEIDKDDFAVVISNSYPKSLKSKMSKFIERLQEEGITYIFVKSVRDYCFNINLSSPSFKDIFEKVGYYDNLSNFIPPPVPEEIPLPEEISDEDEDEDEELSVQDSSNGEEIVSGVANTLTDIGLHTTSVENNNTLTQFTSENGDTVYIEVPEFE